MTAREHRRISAALANSRPARSVRVICLGLSALDQVWRVERLFAGESEKIRSLDYTTLGGGMAANAAVAVARLGGCDRVLGPRRR